MQLTFCHSTHTRKHTHRYTAEWALDARQYVQPPLALSRSRSLALFASVPVWVHAIGLDIKHWRHSCQNPNETTNATLKERERDDGRVAEWESAAILRIMLYKRFALCLLPQAESVASRCARWKCMYIGHWTHQWSLDTEHWTLVAWQVIKMLKYDLTCH